ncbi:hypothetical protein AYI68_g1354 [Smittium mucronatum]|uniref:Uncharacterized protein n=1 Tax=Smittium mucronatum TaxID=133383 RepID=A0A1R0H5N0_9FUNG|nr:hypothetical protein AYI68_g1354 [Smittium mucronatum]
MACKIHDFIILIILSFAKIMEQGPVNQNPVSQDQYKLSTEIVQQLLREKKRGPKPGDPYANTKISV